MVSTRLKLRQLVRTQMRTVNMPLHLGNFPRPYSVFSARASELVRKPKLHFSSSDIDQSDMLHKRMSFDLKTVGTHHIEFSDGGVTCPSPIPFRVSNYEQNEDRRGLNPLAIDPSLSPWSDSRSERKSTRFNSQLLNVALFRSRCLLRRLGSLLECGGRYPKSEWPSLFRAAMILIATTRDWYLILNSTKHTRLAIRDKRKNFGYAYGYCIEIGPLQKSLTACHAEAK